jgi:DNA-binding transcriptional ArsR family regulator
MQIQPDWFDDDRDVVLTPTMLRGLVHPLRLRILRMLREDGPSTASRLGERIGQSSGVTSYHLRQLAEHGFIVEDTERGNGRDRWWRAAFRWMAFTFRNPADPGDPETIELAEQFMRVDAGQMYERMLRYVDSLGARASELPTAPWSFSSTPLRLPPERVRELTDKVHELIAEYRREPEDADPAPGTVRAMFQFQMLPDELSEPGPGGDPGAGM